MTACPFCRRIYVWLYNVEIAQDEELDALTGGSARESVSSRLGRKMLAGSRVAAVLCAILGFCFRNPAHCVGAIITGDDAPNLPPNLAPAPPRP